MPEMTAVRFATIGALGAAGGAVLGSILGPLITGSFGLAGRLIDTDPKITEMAIAILQTKPTPATEQLRTWAVDVVDKRAKPSLSQKQREELLKVELPAGRGAASR